MTESLPVTTLTCAQALTAARTLGLERLDAQLLLLHALGKPGTERAWLLTHDTDPLPGKAAPGWPSACSSSSGPSSRSSPSVRAAANACMQVRVVTGRASVTVNCY